MTSFFVSLFVFCLLGAGGMAVWAALYGSHRVLEERFADLAVQIRAAQGVFNDDEEQDDSFGRTFFKWASKRVPAPDLDTPAGEKLSHTLVQAGFINSSAAHAFQVLRVILTIGAALAGAIVGLILGKNAATAILYALMGGAVGFLAPLYYITRRARMRQTAIARQLSDVLDLLVVCVEAGLGLFEAIKIVGTESERQKQEIGRELALVTSEISAGATLGHALHASSDALRTRRRLRAEEAAQRTTVKILFPLVLFILPAMLLVIVGPAIIQILHTLAGS